MKNNEDKERVREHYSKAAPDRSARLQKNVLNPAKHNHKLRYRIISKAFPGHDPAEKGVDIGTGTGVWAEFLCKRCSKVDGVDFVEENLAIARKNAEKLGLEEKITYYRDDVEDLSFAKNEDYDLAIMISVLQHLPDQDKTLKRIHEILKRGGRFVILVHNRRCLFNYSLWRARKSGAELPVNDYSTVSEIKTRLREAGFCVRGGRLAWLFFTDVFFLGLGRPYTGILMPFRKILIALSAWTEPLLSRFTFLDFLFREILIVCSKEDGNG